jgi:hypothetical protein
MSVRIFGSHVPDGVLGSVSERSSGRTDDEPPPPKPEQPELSELSERIPTPAPEPELPERTPTPEPRPELSDSEPKPDTKPELTLEIPEPKLKPVTEPVTVRELTLDLEQNVAKSA